MSFIAVFVDLVGSNNILRICIAGQQQTTTRFPPFRRMYFAEWIQITFFHIWFFFSSSTRLEAISESRVELKCSLYNVHHEIDMDRLTVEWIASKYQPGNRMSSGLCELISHFCFWENMCKENIHSYFSKFKNICNFFYRSKYFL